MGAYAQTFNDAVGIKIATSSQFRNQLMDRLTTEKYSSIFNSCVQFDQIMMAESYASAICDAFSDMEIKSHLHELTGKPEISSQLLKIGLSRLAYISSL